MTKPAADYFKQFRSKAEIRADEELEHHNNNECEGLPNCPYCIEDWEQANREELDSQGYYIGDKWTR